MRRVRRQAIVPYPASTMYALVNDVASYPEFLPWCRSSEVHEEREDFMEASLQLVKGSWSGVFTTSNHLVPGQRIEIGLREGPFRHLEGVWVFDSLSDAGSEVSLRLDFEFRNALAGLVAGPIFEDIANSLVDSFVHRARKICDV
jgi:ribosome-associated toxin RatA of RatAB toxin-antitoxin module